MEVYLMFLCRSVSSFNGKKKKKPVIVEPPCSPENIGSIVSQTFDHNLTTGSPSW